MSWITLLPESTRKAWLEQISAIFTPDELWARAQTLPEAPFPDDEQIEVYAGVLVRWAEESDSVSALLTVTLAPDHPLLAAIQRDPTAPPLDIGFIGAKSPENSRLVRVLGRQMAARLGRAIRVSHSTGLPVVEASAVVVLAEPDHRPLTNAGGAIPLVGEPIVLLVKPSPETPTPGELSWARVHVLLSATPERTGPGNLDARTVLLDDLECILSRIEPEEGLCATLGEVATGEALDLLRLRVFLVKSKVKVRPEAKSGETEAPSPDDSVFVQLLGPTDFERLVSKIRQHANDRKDYLVWWKEGASREADFKFSAASTLETFELELIQNLIDVRSKRATATQLGVAPSAGPLAVVSPSENSYRVVQELLDRGMKAIQAPDPSNQAGRTVLKDLLKNNSAIRIVIVEGANNSITNALLEQQVQQHAPNAVIKPLSKNVLDDDDARNKFMESTSMLYGPIAPSNNPVHVFYSYVGEESEILKAFMGKLVSYREAGMLSEYTDHNLSAARNFNQQLMEAIEKSDIVVLCYSSKYAAAPYCKAEREFAESLVAAGRVQMLFILYFQDILKFDLLLRVHRVSTWRVAPSPATSICGLTQKPVPNKLIAAAAKFGAAIEELVG